MANLVARYRSPDGDVTVLWSRPLPAGPVIVGQTEHPGATNMADWGIAEPGVAKPDQAQVGGRHFEVAWDGTGLVVTPTHSPGRAPVVRADTLADAPVGEPFLVRPGGRFTVGPFEFGVVVRSRRGRAVRASPRPGLTATSTIASRRTRRPRLQYRTNRRPTAAK